MSGAAASCTLGALEVYRQVGHETRTPRQIDFDALLGRDLPNF